MAVEMQEALKELGFSTASAKVDQQVKMKRQLMVAYEHFTFVTPQNVERFNKALAEKTRKNHNGYSTYDKLVFIPVAQYAQIPPMDVLQKMKAAKELDCFDLFEVAKIETVEERPDPIIFGRVTGCEDRFFVAQWDNDVKIDDILEAHEG